jgi:hypothetical protein
MCPRQKHQRVPTSSGLPAERSSRLAAYVPPSRVALPREVSDIDLDVKHPLHQTWVMWYLHLPLHLDNSQPRSLPIVCAFRSPSMRAPF